MTRVTGACSGTFPSLHPRRDRERRPGPHCATRCEPRMSPHSGANCRPGASRRLSGDPEFNERWADILAELGIGWDTIVKLKVRSVAG